MPTAQELVDTFRRWTGTAYRFGGEQTDCTPRDVDCSEGVEWACRCADVTPTMPDGSGNQFDHCDRNGGRVPFDQGRNTIGALLFKSYGTSYPPGDRNDGGIYHVAMVSGPDRTMEICCDDGDKVVERSISGRSWYGWATLIPGVDYSITPTPTPPWPAWWPPLPPRKEPDMLIASPAGRVHLLHAGRLVYIHTGADLDSLTATLGDVADVEQDTWDALVSAYGEPVV